MDAEIVAQQIEAINVSFAALRTSMRALDSVRSSLTDIAHFLAAPEVAIFVFITDTEGVQVGDITVKDSDPAFHAAVTFLDAKGAPTHPDDMPQWSSDSNAVATVSPGADGLTATVAPQAPGATAIKVTSTDADGTVITAQGTVTVEPGEAVTGSVDFGPAPATA